MLAQIKAGNNSLKNEIRKIYLLYQHNTVTKKVYNNLIKPWKIKGNIIAIKDSKTFCFNFDWPKYIDHENLKHETEFIITNNESLAENKIKMETIFMNTENSKTNESHKLVLNLSQRLDLRGSNKHVALLFIIRGKM